MNKELAAKIDSYLAENRQAIVEDLKTLVRIPSVSVETPGDKPFGEHCALALDTALALAKERGGMRAVNHDYYYGTAEWGGGDKTIGIFSHLDVVPEGGGWIHKPYDPVEKDGFLIGRGVADNKSGAIAGIYIARCLDALELPFNSRISLYFGCSEETGMKDIEHYVAEQPMPDFSIVPDTNFPVCHGEKGILEGDVHCKVKFAQIADFRGGLASNMVPDSAEVRLPMYGDLIDGLQGMSQSTEGITVTEQDGQILVRAKGVSSHAARPEGSVNAIGRLAAFLSEARGLDDRDRHIMAMVADTLSDTDGGTTGIAASDAPSGSLTCIYGMAKTVEGQLQLNFNIRYPVTHDGGHIVAILQDYFAQQGWNLADYKDSAPAYLPKDDPKVRQLCDIYADITGKPAEPYVMGGGTYARKLKNAIGFGMESDRATPFPAGHGGVHQPDEVLYIDDMMEAIKIYVMSMLEIDKILHR